MHVCQEAKLSSRVRCPICGQDFLIYAESGISAVDTMSRRVIEHALRTHHNPRSTTASAHPGPTFPIPAYISASAEPHRRNKSKARPMRATKQAASERANPVKAGDAKPRT